MNMRNPPILPCLMLFFALLLPGCTLLPTAAEAESQKTAATEAQWHNESRKIIDGLASIGVAAETQDDGSLLFRLAAAHGFEKDSDKPTAELMRPLNEVAGVLAGYPQTLVQVTGHTDSIGSELYNLQLSIRRAEAVMEYLRQSGIELKRLSADGHGEAEPIADNRTLEGRAENRRVEIVVRLPEVQP